MTSSCMRNSLILPSSPINRGGRVTSIFHPTTIQKLKKKNVEGCASFISSFAYRYPSPARVRSDDEEMNYFFRVNIQYCSSFVVCFNIDGISPTLQLKCEQCGWISENEVCVNMAVQERAPGSSNRNNRVNLSLKCEGCERQGTITLVPEHGRPLRADDCTNVPLMVFDCNGIFPVYYSLNGGWSAVTESGRSINLNLVEGKYNAVVNGEYIEIKELKTKFEPYNG
ncbi:hypothetical protein CK203_099522 [Vitis vinifera]|uniref:Uncharacterized protein n=1 Tax=Vitis vinifera TaxID=29760 RepID=A0A438EVZ7_VITVI|nr:hypothetical protein CK203_099522 [Vitis vinifera]